MQINSRILYYSDREVACGTSSKCFKLPCRVVACSEAVHINPPTSHFTVKVRSRTLIVQRASDYLRYSRMHNRVVIK